MDLFCSTIVKQSFVKVSWFLLFVLVILNKLENELVQVDFSKDKIQHLLKGFSNENGIVFRDMMAFLRMSLSGLKVK